MFSDETFLVVGEVVADVVHTDDGATHVHPGGSPANVAYGLARLGRPVALVTQLADDAHGRLLRTHLGSVGVDVRTHGAVARTPSATANIGTDGSASYDFDIAWTLPAVGGGEDPASHMHTGSIAAFLEPGRSAVEGELQRRRPSATTSFDPNIRPLLLPDRAAACAAAERLVRLSDVVKASDEDLLWLHPDADPMDVAQRWHSDGTALVVVTCGADGARAFVGGEEATVPAEPVAVVDTVGAGDAFMSALLDGLAALGAVGLAGRDRLRVLRGADVEALLARAARAAAITVGRAGAHPPDVSELDPVASSGAR